MAEQEIRELELKEAKEREEKREAQEARNREILLELIAAGTVPEPRPLTRKERKAMDEAGCNFSKPKTGENRKFGELIEDTYDWIIDNIYPGQLDNVSNNIANYIALRTYNMTYNDDLAIKN
ncbi:hypothetical protein [Pelosinus sp. UFO1]|uniref:hypothetical protein n=1 Tax=Pelosinus sp. UFO1 TaxID=484770 RepID=UPI0004D1F714|nr:hypothetical protein [Pelosinus sp. UFO1]AIF52002.1 hypothetical protein UFO1_2455 [Pelosinus sp. UFO1]